MAIGMLAALVSNPLRFSSFLFAILLLIHGYWALTEGAYYGVKDVAVTWFGIGGGVIILDMMFTRFMRNIKIMIAWMILVTVLAYLTITGVIF